MSPNYTIHHHTSVAYVPTETPLFWWSTGLTSIDSDARASSLPGWAGLLAIVVVLTIFAASFASSFLRLRHIPGPWWATYSRSWLMSVLASGDAATKFEEVNRKFGPLARIGPNHLLIDDPFTARRLLDTHSQYSRNPGFDSFKTNPRLANVVAEQDSSKHERLRRQLAPGYGGKDIECVEDNVNSRIDEWMRTVDKEWTSPSNTTKVFDISRMIQYLTMDVITHLLFGEPFGYVRTQSDIHGMLQIVRERLPVVEVLSLYTELRTLILFISYIPWVKNILPNRRDEHGIGRVMKVAHQVVSKRFQPDAAPRNDMLGSFLRHGLTQEQAESEITVSIFAGSDTTATSTRATLLNIVTNPVVYAKLQLEIDNAISSGSISSPIQIDEAIKLPYLQACIKEGLRIFPPVAGLRERITPPEGDYLNGYFVPSGVNIGFNLRTMQRHQIFGSDPYVFRPERWLESDPERIAEMEKVHGLIFNHGGAKCLGIRIANMTLNKFFFELLRRFDVTVLNPYHPFETICHQIFFVKELKVRCTRRERLPLESS